MRLLQGSFSQSSTYDADPVEQARGFERAGARLVHIVDLDAAEGRGADNRAVISRIRGAVCCALEVGGGIRSAEDAGRLLDLGIERLVVGTILARAPREVAAWTARWGRRFVAGIDARGGRVRVSGWTTDGGILDVDLARSASDLGAVGVVYTAIERDGTLAGPDVERTSLVARAAGLPTVLSGGISSEEDVEAVFAAADPLVAGVIVGKALYEGRVDLAALVARWPQDPAALGAELR